MTKKHFRALAQNLNNIKPNRQTEEREYLVWERSVRAIADICEQTNPRFDYQKFFLACEKGL